MTEAFSIPDDIMRKAQDVLEACKRHGVMVVTAESCTGGLVAAVLTDAKGASQVVHGGFVTYANEAKVASLGVAPELLDAYGAVSEPVARAMVEGALAHSSADVAVSVTGIAGPDGGSEDKPVGLVHFAAMRRGSATVHVERRFGDVGRAEVRRRAVRQALELVELVLESASPRTP